MIAGVDSLLNGLAQSVESIAEHADKPSDNACEQAAERALLAARDVRLSLLRMNESLHDYELTSTPSCSSSGMKSAHTSLLSSILDALSKFSTCKFTYSAKVSRASGGDVRLQSLTCVWEGVLAAVLYFDAAQIEASQLPDDTAKREPVKR